MSVSFPWFLIVGKLLATRFGSFAKRFARAEDGSVELVEGAGKDGKVGKVGRWEEHRISKTYFKMVGEWFET